MRLRSAIVFSLLILAGHVRASTFVELNAAISSVDQQMGTLDVFYAAVQILATNQRLKVEQMIPKIDARLVSPVVKAALLAKALAIVTKLEAVEDLRGEIADTVTNVSCYYDAALGCRDREDYAAGMVATDEANRYAAIGFGLYAEAQRQQDAIDTDIAALQQLVDA